MAVAARQLQNAQEFARKHSIPQAYGGYEALARDPNIGEFVSDLGQIWVVAPRIWFILIALY